MLITGGTTEDILEKLRYMCHKGLSCVPVEVARLYKGERNADSDMFLCGENVLSVSRGEMEARA